MYSLRQDLVQLEKQIFDLEGNYLENTRDFGNIFHGWNQYVSQRHLYSGSDTGPGSGSGPGGGGRGGRGGGRGGRGGRRGVLNEERLFSLSSASSPASRREEVKKVGPVCVAAVQNA